MCAYGCSLPERRCAPSPSLCLRTPLDAIVVEPFSRTSACRLERRGEFPSCANPSHLRPATSPSGRCSFLEAGSSLSVIRFNMQPSASGGRACLGFLQWGSRLIRASEGPGWCRLQAPQWCKGHAVGRARPQGCQGCPVLRGSVSFVPGESVPGVQGTEVNHHPVAMDLGYDGRGGDG